MDDGRAHRGSRSPRRRPRPHVDHPAADVANLQVVALHGDELELDLLGDLGDEGICALARMGPLQGLARLTVRTHRAGLEAARALVRSRLLDSVTDLHRFLCRYCWW
jgi:hypothetical protein